MPVLKYSFFAIRYKNIFPTLNYFIYIVEQFYHGKVKSIIGEIFNYCEQIKCNFFQTNEKLNFFYELNSIVNVKFPLLEDKLNEKLIILDLRN